MAILQELGLQDIARIDGWVKVDRPDPPLPELELETPDSDTAESDSADSDTEESPGSEQPITDSSGMVTYDHTSASEQLSEVVEQLPDDVFEYNSSPISQRAVPILPLDLQAEDADDYTNMGSEYVQAESQLVGAESAGTEPGTGSDDGDSISTDTEEEEESSLLMADASPQELCTYVTPDTRLCVAKSPLHEAASTAFLCCLVTTLGPTLYALAAASLPCNVLLGFCPSAGSFCMLHLHKSRQPVFAFMLRPSQHAYTGCT